MVKFYIQILLQRLKLNSNISYALNDEHPVVQDFDSKLSEIHSKDFQQLIRLFSAGLPLEALQNDMTDNFDALRQNKLDESDLTSHGLICIKKFRELGYDNQEIINLMNAIPPFVGAKDTIQKIMNNEVD